MNRLWIVLAVLVALFVVARLRARRRLKPARRPLASGPRIHGSQVSGWVHPRMSPLCLYDSDVQFGKGFRRKEEPRLPHDAQCGCTLVAFSFTSSEVFNGALRNATAARSSIEGLEPAQVQQLVERLREAEAQPLSATVADYAAQIDLGRFPTALHTALHAFLAERHAHLLQQPASERPPEPGEAQRGVMEPTEPTELT